MTSPFQLHQKGFEREVSLMVLTLEDRVQEVTQSNQFSLHYRLYLGVHLRPVNTSLRDLCMNPQSVMDVERLDILRDIVQNSITDLQMLEVEVVMAEVVILEDVVVEVMVVTRMAEVMGNLEPQRTDG